VVNCLIRVRLPDRPGALGAVASRIGSVGADVISIDILQREGGVVVDELGVRLQGDHLVTLLRDEILEVDGVAIESVRSVDGDLPDRDGELLALVSGLFGPGGRPELLGRLVAGVRRGLAATFAAVLEPGPVVAAGDGVLPDTDELERFATGDPSSGPGAARAVNGPDATVVVEQEPAVATVALPSAGMVLVVGRTRPGLRSRELRWISIMAELVDRGWRASV
jgi:hypothetical protein